MNLRLATSSDLVEVMALYYEAADAMEHTPYDCRWRRGGHPSTEFVKELIDDGGMLVALADGEVVGAVGIDHDLGHDYGYLPWLVEVDPEDAAVIHLLVVREGWRGRGIARLLLRACLDEAQTRGMRTARLDATANNAPAIALYLEEGFHVIGEDVLNVGLEDDPLVPFVVMERLLA